MCSIEWVGIALRCVCLHGPSGAVEWPWGAGDVAIRHYRRVRRLSAALVTSDIAICHYRRIRQCHRRTQRVTVHYVVYADDIAEYAYNGR